MASSNQAAHRCFIIAFCSISQLTFTLAQASSTMSAPAPAPSAAGSGPSIGLYQAHGILMFLGFGLFMPMGIIIARHAQSFTRFWFHLHWIFQITAVSCVVPAFAIAIHYFAALPDSLHAKLGVAVFILMCLQPVMAILRPHKGNLYRPIWYLCHWMFGTSAVILGWYEIYTGLALYSVDWCTDNCTAYLQNWFTGVVAFFGFVYLFLGRWEHMMSQSRGDGQVGAVDRYPSMHPQGISGQEKTIQMNQLPSIEEGGVDKEIPFHELPV